VGSLAVQLARRTADCDDVAGLQRYRPHGRHSGRRCDVETTRAKPIERRRLSDELQCTDRNVLSLGGALFGPAERLPCRRLRVASYARRPYAPKEWDFIPTHRPVRVPAPT
jgi:hypothetical protein